MFIHNFKYALKTLFRNKMLIFWTFAFPIILGTLFNMAFSNIENSEKLDAISIAVIEDENFNKNEVFKEALKTLSDEKSKDQLFQTSYVSEQEAKEMLKEGEITGYLTITTEGPKITIASNGMNETILKYVIEEIDQTSQIVESLAAQEIQKEMMQGNQMINYEAIYQQVLEMAQAGDVNLKNISNSNLSYMMIEFYTLIAMTCLYGGILGVTSINKNLANMSEKGKRVAVSPVSKAKLVLSSVLASYVTQLIGIALLFVYTIFVLKIDYGNNLPMILLLTLTGTLAGLSLGVTIGTILKSKEDMKTGIIISITMLGCFLSGMMGVTMKYIVDKNIPWINKINPASMITDGFYSLYYYDTLDRFFLNVISLFIFSFILIFIAYLSLRRQKYDSI